MKVLKETEEWGTQWAGKLFRLIFEHDMATKAAVSKVSAHKAATSRSVFINATPDTYLNSEGSRATRKKS